MIFNSLEIQDKLQRIVIFFALLCVLWSPVYTFILLGIGFAIRNNAEKRKFYTVVLIALLVVCAMVFNLEDVSYIFPNSIESPRTMPGGARVLPTGPMCARVRPSTPVTVSPVYP